MTNLQKSNAVNKKQEITDFENLDSGSEDYGLEEFEADFDDIGDETLSFVGGEEIDGFSSSELEEAGVRTGHARISLQKIRELEAKLSAASGLPEFDELSKILDEAEASVVEAERCEKFSFSSSHREKAQSLQAQASEAYEEVSEAIEEGLADQEDAMDGKPQDSKPKTTDSKKKTALYEGETEVILHNDFTNDKIDTHNLKEVNKVTLYPSNPTDTFVVIFDADTQQYKITATAGDQKNAGVKTYFVDPTALGDKIIIASTKVDTSQLSKEMRDKIQVGLDKETDEKTKKLEIMNSMEWPAEGIAAHIDFENHNDSHLGGGGTLARFIVQGKAGTSDRDFPTNYRPDSDGIDGAIRTGNWDGVLKTVRAYSDHDWNTDWTQYNDEYSNDAIRRIVSGIYRASGATHDRDPRFMGLLKKIPTEVRYAMRDAVRHNTRELSENHGDQWNSDDTASLIDLSFQEVPPDMGMPTATTSNGASDNSQDDASDNGETGAA